MTWSIAFLFLLIAGMVYLFLTEKLPVELTAFVGLTFAPLVRKLGGVRPVDAGRSRILASRSTRSRRSSMGP